MAVGEPARVSRLSDSGSAGLARVVVRLEDVLALKVKRHEARRVALDALREVDDELGIDVPTQNFHRCPKTSHRALLRVKV